MPSIVPKQFVPKDSSKPKETAAHGTALVLVIPDLRRSGRGVVSDSGSLVSIGFEPVPKEEV